MASLRVPRKSMSRRKYYGKAGRNTSVLFPGRRHVNIGRYKGVKLTRGARKMRRR